MLTFFFFRVPVEVPTACTKFQHELLYQTDHILGERFVNLFQSKEYSEGGHFAAFEIPDVLADDMWSAIEIFEKINNNK